MEYRQSEALVLRVIDFQETSKIISAYTREWGRISLLAKGAKRPKNKFFCRLEPFNAGIMTLTYKETREVQTLTEFETHSSYGGELVELEQMSLMGRIGHLLMHTLFDNKAVPRLFHLIQGTFENIAKGRTPSHLNRVYLYFLYHFLRLNGLGADYELCSSCHHPLNSVARICFADFSILCDRCSFFQSYDYSLTNNELIFFQHLEKMTPDASIQCKISEKAFPRLLAFFNLAYQVHFNYRISDYRVSPAFSIPKESSHVAMASLSI